MFDFKQGKAPIFKSLVIAVGMVLTLALLLAIFGPETSQARDSLTQGTPKANLFVAQQPTGQPQQTETTEEPFLSSGNEGLLVEELQNTLKLLGYYQEEIDGIYGTNTEIAVSEYQKSVGLEPDGIVSLSLWQSLKGGDSGSSLPPSQTKMPPDIQKILDRGELIVAMRGIDTPPFFMYDQNNKFCGDDPSTYVIDEKGKLCGLDVEIAKALADELGVKLKLDRSQTDFSKVVELVLNSQADLAISKLSISPNRAIRLRFSQPYVNMRRALLVNRVLLAQQTKNRRPIEAIKNLEGNIGVIQNTTYLHFAKEIFPNATPVQFSSWEAIIEAVANEKILAAYRDEMEVKKVVLTQPNTALKVQTVALTDTKDSIAAILPWDSQQLLTFVNVVLDTKNFNYTVDDLIEKYQAVFQKQESL
jgi:ABC-type amino acid transport substrate-binding protein